MSVCPKCFCKASNSYLRFLILPHYLLKCLHWPLVRFKDEFKIFVLAFMVLRGEAPTYVISLLHPYSPNFTPFQLLHPCKRVQEQVASHVLVCRFFKLGISCFLGECVNYYTIKGLHNYSRGLHVYICFMQQFSNRLFTLTQ